MISFKVLVILTVTIDLICCQGNQEIDECTNTFKTIGFTPGSGFFNYNFAKQFENFNEFLSYAKAKLNLRKTVNNSGTTSNNTIPESTFNDKKRSYSEMMYASEKEFLLGENSYLLPIYKRILKASNSVIIMNPPQFCRTMMNHILNKKRSEKEGPEKAGSEKEGPEKAGSEKEGPEKAGSEKEGPEKAGSEKEGPEKADVPIGPVKDDKPDENLRKIVAGYASGQTPTNITISLIDIAVLKDNATYLEHCINLITAFQFEYKNNIYGYTRNNENKNIVTSFNLALLPDNNDIIGSLELPMNAVETKKYFDYHMTLYKEFGYDMTHLRIRELCYWSVNQNIDKKKKEKPQSEVIKLLQ